jgi:hypothetical protein
MSKPSSRAEQSFGDLLRQEARASQPGFSGPLHSDICHAVRQLKADQLVIQHAGVARMRRLWSSLAVAAVVVLVTIVAWRTDRPAEIPERRQAHAADPAAIAQLPGTPSLSEWVDRVALNVDRRIADTFVTEQLAYLEHDTRVLASAVTGGSLLRFVEPDGGHVQP